MRKILIPAILVGTLGIVGNASASTGDHVCRQGDPPITASARTSCAFAGRMVDAFVNVCGMRNCRSIVYSPTTHRFYNVTFRKSGWTVVATGPNGIKARFSADI